MVKKIPLAMSACLLSTACAHLPDVKIAYYPSQSKTYVTATQTISCSVDGSAVTTTTAVTQNTMYSAEPTMPDLAIPMPNSRRPTTLG